jgi:hypothetical protein
VKVWLWSFTVLSSTAMFFCSCARIRETKADDSRHPNNSLDALARAVYRYTNSDRIVLSASRFVPVCMRVRVSYCVYRDIEYYTACMPRTERRYVSLKSARMPECTISSYYVTQLPLSISNFYNFINKFIHSKFCVCIHLCLRMRLCPYMCVVVLVVPLLVHVAQAKSSTLLALHSKPWLQLRVSVYALVRVYMCADLYIWMYTRMCVRTCMHVCYVCHARVCVRVCSIYPRALICVCMCACTISERLHDAAGRRHHRYKRITDSASYTPRADRTKSCRIPSSCVYMLVCSIRVYEHVPAGLPYACCRGLFTQYVAACTVYATDGIDPRLPNTLSTRL